MPRVTNFGEDLDPNTEGPYWDYMAVAEWAGKERDTWARIVADYVLIDDLETAKRRATIYAAAKERCHRITDRYDATKDADYSWIGWSYRSGAGLNATGARGRLA